MIIEFEVLMESEGKHTVNQSQKVTKRGIKYEEKTYAEYTERERENGIMAEGETLHPPPPMTPHRERERATDEAQHTKNRENSQT